MKLRCALARVGGGLLAAALLASAAGCGARSAPPPPTAVDDALLAVRVRTALVNHPALGALPFDVGVAAGVVRLGGTVPSAGEAELAQDVVRGVPGVVGVKCALAVGEPDMSARAASLAASASPDTARERLPALAPPPREGPLRIVGVGGSARVSRPATAGLGRTLAVGPLLRLRPRNGLGPAVAFNWTNAEIETGPRGEPGLATVQLRPIMGGIELGTVRGRFWAGASIVAGYSFNSLGVDTGRVGQDRAIAVGNGFVWRPAGAMWFDVTPRVGIQVMGGYLFTSPEVTFAGDAAITSGSMRLNSAIVSVGAAYWIF